MSRTTCPSCQSVQEFSQRSPVLTGTPNGHDVALVQCDGCGFAVLAYYERKKPEILRHYPVTTRCMSCETALRG